LLGGARTTVTALKSGVPQIIIPVVEDWSDQLFHGSKVSPLGCGTLLRPRTNLDDNPSDIVRAIRDHTSRPSVFKRNCDLWKTKLGEADLPGHEGLSTAVDVIRRTIAGVLTKKVEGT